MENKRIRLLAVEREGNNPFLYVTDKPINVSIDGQTEKRTITNIVLVGEHFELYLSDGAIAKHWKDIPKTNKVTIEYYI